MEIQKKISAVIITFNEEKNIKRCLESLLGVADEIIVVDSFSTDQTENICKQYQVKFISQAWLGYSGQKNFGNSLATSDYILSIDADEALSDELKKSLLDLKINPAHDIYSIKRLTNYCGKWIKHCGWYPDKKIRVWKNGKSQWHGEIHESIQYDTGLTVSELKGDLLHYSYYTIQDHLSQINLFTEIMAKDEVKKGKTVTILQLLLSPLFKFFKSYFIKLGFLDGYYGFIVCVISAQASFYKYLKIRELLKK